MSDTTYTATLVGPNGTETIELELIGGLPQKSFPRATEEEGEDQIWELVPDAEGHEYRPAGIPGADYS